MGSSLVASSAALDLGVLTNITQDHLDFHGTFAKYLEAKTRFFTELGRESGPKKKHVPRPPSSTVMTSTGEGSAILSRSMSSPTGSMLPRPSWPRPLRSSPRG